MLPTVIALLVFALLGLGLTYWLRRPPAPRVAAERARERNANLLASLHWREFTRLVLQAMHGRGLRPVIAAGTPSDGIPTNGGDILLERHGEHTLLSCKYGSGSIVGAQALLGLAKSATLQGASHVIVVTPGRFDEEAVRIAQQQDIELLDGESLWPEVRPYVHLPDVDEKPVEPVSVHTPNTRPLALAWGGAAVAAAIVWLLLGGAHPDDAAAPDTSVTANTARPGRASEQPQQIVPQERIPTDPAVLEQRRKETASAISTLFGVARAYWSTQSTLFVQLSSEHADPSNELCPLMLRYPELAASRVQLQPPDGSSKPVRFKQCRSY
ncbi:MAG: restriction endonuclease [Thermomonas sp.]|uniref:restriction endonuclease n=1 Tax=Thermomonas sp. TaxID=1971895 RepID=UPI0039E53287